MFHRVFLLEWLLVREEVLFMAEVGRISVLESNRGSLVTQMWIDFKTHIFFLTGKTSEMQEYVSFLFHTN